MSASGLANSNEWRTPAWLFRPLHRRYRYAVDVAAAKWNAQLPRHFTQQFDAFRHPWGPRFWCNPPYSRGNLRRWSTRARLEVLYEHAELGSLLVPHSTADGWWHDVVEAPAGRFRRCDPPRQLELGAERTTWWTELGIRVLTLNRRVAYEHQSGAVRGESARHHSVVVTFLHPRCRR